MNLRQEAQRLRLDLLATEVSQALERAGIPHVLLKGPSTATWLYDPPRLYNDVDILVPLSAVRGAKSALALIDVFPVDEEAGPLRAPSLLMRSQTTGFEVDLHVSLPALVPDGDRVWTALSSHVVALDLGVGVVPALDEPARCVVVALHALNAGSNSGREVEDLRRARVAAPTMVWLAAEKLADELAVVDLFSAGVAMAETDIAGVGSARAYLRASGFPALAGGLQRLAVAARRRDLFRQMWAEIIPSATSLQRMYPDTANRRFALLHAYVTRWIRLVRELSRAIKLLLPGRGRK